MLLIFDLILITQTCSQEPSGRKSCSRFRPGNGLRALQSIRRGGLPMEQPGSSTGIVGLRGTGRRGWKRPSSYDVFTKQSHFQIRYGYGMVGVTMYICIFQVYVCMLYFVGLVLFIWCQSNQEYLYYLDMFVYCMHSHISWLHVCFYVVCIAIFLVIFVWVLEKACITLLVVCYVLLYVIKIMQMVPFLVR